MGSIQSLPDLLIQDDLTQDQLEYFERVFRVRHGDSLVVDVYDAMRHLVDLVAKEDLSTDTARAACARKAMLRFVDIFAGATVVVPSPEQVNRCIRDVVIYLTAKKSGYAGNTISDLARRYELASRAVSQICTAAREELEKVDEQEAPQQAEHRRSSGHSH